MAPRPPKALLTAESTLTSRGQISHFLDFLERHGRAYPERIQAVDANRVERAQDLTQDVDIALDAPLRDDDE